jgi:hypothetical protein
MRKWTTIIVRKVQMQRCELKKQRRKKEYQLEVRDAKREIEHDNLRKSRREICQISMKRKTEKQKKR